MMDVLIRRGNADTDRYRGTTVLRHREKTAIYEPKREASEETSPASTLIADV